MTKKKIKEEEEIEEDATKEEPKKVRVYGDPIVLISG